MTGNGRRTEYAGDIQLPGNSYVYCRHGIWFCNRKNGFVQINLPDATVEQKPAKKTVEQQLEDMMNYDGKVRKGGE